MVLVSVSSFTVDIVASICAYIIIASLRHMEYRMAGKFGGVKLWQIW